MHKQYFGITISSVYCTALHRRRLLYLQLLLCTNEKLLDHHINNNMYSSTHTVREKREKIDYLPRDGGCLLRPVMLAILCLLSSMDSLGVVDLGVVDLGVVNPEWWVCVGLLPEWEDEGILL